MHVVYEPSGPLKKILCSRFQYQDCEINIQEIENMYRVSIELYKHEWKFGRTRNAVGTRAADECFHGGFRVLPNFHECLYNSIETRRGTCFLFLLENTTMRKRKTTC